MNINNTHGSQEDVYTSEPRVYEIGYHILSSIDEENIEQERDALVAIITKYKGLVISEEIPALIDLAYNIDKIIENKRQSFSQAYFGWIKFNLNPDLIGNLEEDVSSLKSILRFIVIKTVRENTIFSEKPYKLAKVDNASSQDEDFDDIEEEIDQTVDEDVSVVKDKEDSSDEIKDKNQDDSELEVDNKVDEKDESEAVDIEDKNDDLTKIEGIGPKIAEIFYKSGIKTFADLSESKIADLRKILEENKLSSHDPKTWSKQATLAKNEKWEKLAELQDELKGGK